jgi:precorrin-6A/cobalt-precorrin-6A reductase
MHRPANHQGPLLWLIAGTGDGLRLAPRLLAQGWRLLVSVVGEEAALAYRGLADVEVRVGPLAGEAGIRAVLLQARRRQDPIRAVVDASHPFACRITAALARLGREADDRPPLLRLWRPDCGEPAPARLQILADPAALAGRPFQGRRLLLAIGARQLGEVVDCTPGALHHARLLPSPRALQQGRAAGIAAERLACLRPGDPLERAVLAALLERWRIEVIVCRQSGGLTERLWRSLARDLDRELLLLARPPEPPGLEGLEWEPLLRRLQGLRSAARFPLHDASP